MKNADMTQINEYRGLRKGMLRKWLSGFLAVSTAVTMLSGQAVSFYGDETDSVYALAGEGSGEDITIHFGDGENKSINVHVNPEPDAEVLPDLGSEALSDETETETEAETEAENTGLEEVEAGGFVVIKSADGSLLPEEAEGNAEILTGKAENTAIEKVEEAVNTETVSETAVPADNISQDNKEEEPAGEEIVPETESAPDAAGKTEYQAFDISLDNVNEEEYQDGFKVEVSLPEDIKGRNFKLYHIHEGEEPVEIPVTLVETTDPETGVKVVSGFEFETEGFSEFVLKYTVDFHWTVDGKKYVFSIPGGGFVSFRKLVELLGIAYDTDDWNSKNEEADADNAQPETALIMDDVEVSDTTRDFVDGVENVVFSSPELVWVGKVESENTVGGMKEENHLDVEYSAQLTEEQIAEINAQTVEAGDWALISLQAFISEETLTVTMKNGEQFEIRVTDAQDPSVFLGKEVIIYDYDEKNTKEKLAMTSNWEKWNQQRPQFNSVSIQRAKHNPTAKGHWKIVRVNGAYYIQSIDGKYLTIDQNNVGLVNNLWEATALNIQAGTNPDYRISASSDYQAVLTFEPNENYPGFFCAPNSAYSGTNTTRRWLYIEEVTPFPESTERVGDWMLYFDDDFDEITIHVGETVTLRPYEKWIWKDDGENVQNDHWNIIGKTDWNSISENDTSNADLESRWYDGGSGTDRAKFYWHAYVKKDTELKTWYWSVQGRAMEKGDYVLTNTFNNKQIIVHVVDGNPDPQPKPITNTANIRVNLFDYDKNGTLDPANDKNLANTTEYKDQSTNAMSGDSRKFWFLSSGSGDGSQSWNNYSHAVANPGIVKDQLNSEGYPVLTDSNQDLKYLFDTSKTSWNGGNNDGMIAYPGVSGMFQKDSSGYYYYNSNTNYFYYNTTTNQSFLYEHTYTQTSKDSGTENDKPIGFFPFHQYEATNNLYVNQNTNLNHHIGMSMDVDFTIPRSRLDEYDQPIIFDFSGDDDLWVFVEWEDENHDKHSRLMLDIGGIHQPVHGTINFTTSDLPTGDYTLKVFYLERGGCDSNLSVRFNLPLRDVGDVIFRKVETGNNGRNVPGAVFGLYSSEDCNEESLVATAVSGDDGVVKFADISTDPIDTYYLQEITAPEGYGLNNTVYSVTVGSKNTGAVTTIEGLGISGINTMIEDPPAELTVKKEWDPAVPENVRPVYFKLWETKVNGDVEFTDSRYTDASYVAGKGFELNANNNWTAVFRALPNSRYYAVEPTVPANYSVQYLAGSVTSETASAVTMGNDGQITIKNKLNPIDIPVEKEWLGEGLTPADIQGTTITVKLGRVALKKKGRTLTIYKRCESTDDQIVPKKARLDAEYVIKKIKNAQGGAVNEVIKTYHYGSAQLVASTFLEPGTYTVTETIRSSDYNNGYTATHNGTNSDIGLTCTSAEVVIPSNVDSEEKTVAFTSTYTERTGSLRIRSAMTGKSANLDVSNVIYAVYNSDDECVAYYPYSSFENGEKVVSGLHIGTYRVVESKVPAMYGYNLTRNPAAAENGTVTVSNLEVMDNGSIPVASFSSKYEAIPSHSSYWIGKPGNWSTTPITGNFEYPAGTRVMISIYAPYTWDRIANLVGQQGITDISECVNYGGQSLSYTHTAIEGERSRYTITLNVQENAELIVFINGDQNDITDFQVTEVPPTTRSRLMSRSASPVLKSTGTVPSLQMNRSAGPVKADDPGDLPALPDNKEYVEDTAFNNGTNNTVTLSAANGLTWRGIVENLDAADQDGDPYYYYIQEVVETNTPDVTTPEIVKDTNGKRILVGQDNLNTLTLKAENSVDRKGALKLTKIVQVNGTTPVDANKALTQGTYAFSINGISGTSTANVSHIVQITFDANGQAESATVDGRTVTESFTSGTFTGSVVLDGLMTGDYTIEETDPGNLTLIRAEGGTEVSDNKVVTVHVTAGDHTPDNNEAKATFTNNIQTGRLTVTKEVLEAISNDDVGAITGDAGAAAHAAQYEVKITVTLEDGKTYYVQNAATGALGLTAPNPPLKVSQNQPLDNIPNLPFGTYTVTEVAPDKVNFDNSFSYVVVSQSVSEGNDIISSDNNPATVELRNIYMKGAEWTPEVTKKLNGAPYHGNEFAFNLTLEKVSVKKGNGNETELIIGRDVNAYTKTVSVTNESGKAIFPLIEYTPDEIRTLAGNNGNNTVTFIYSITEIRPEDATESPYIVGNVQYDQKTIYAKAVVEKHGASMSLSHRYYSDENCTQSLTEQVFDNTDLGSLDVTKSVTGSYTDYQNDTFSFTVKRTDVTSNVYVNADQPANSNIIDCQGTNCFSDVSKSYNIKAGDDYKLTFINLPVGTYEITETQVTKDGYTITTTYTHKVPGGTEAVNGSSVDVSKSKTSEVNINNHYRDAELIVKKTILDVEADDLARVANSITITVTDSEGHKLLNNVPLTSTAVPFVSEANSGVYTVTLKSTDKNADGTAPADYAKYIVPDGTYTVTETMTDVDGYVLKSSTYQVTTAKAVMESSASTQSGAAHSLQLTDKNTSTGEIDFENTYVKVKDISRTKAFAEGWPQDTTVVFKLSATVVPLTPDEQAGQGEQEEQSGTQQEVAYTILDAFGNPIPDDVLSKTVTVESPTATWENLPVNTQDGREIHYTVIETQIVIGTGQNQNVYTEDDITARWNQSLDNDTLTNTPVKTEISVQKHWKADEQEETDLSAEPFNAATSQFTLYKYDRDAEQWQMIPLETLQTYKEDNPVNPVSVTGNGTAAWTNLPKYYPDGVEIQYKVEETAASYTDADGNVISFDSNGDEIISSTVTLGEDGVYTAVNVPKTRVKVTKEWYDISGNKMPTAPPEGRVTFDLYSNEGRVLNKDITLYGRTVEPSSSRTFGEFEPWVATWTDLDAYNAEGNRYVYTVKEVNGGWQHYTVSYPQPDAASSEEPGEASGSEQSDETTPKNYAVNGETIINQEQPVSIEVTKAWKDSTGQDKVFDERKTISFTLYQILKDSEGNIISGSDKIYEAYGDHGKGVIEYTPADPEADPPAEAGWSVVKIKNLPQKVYVEQTNAANGTTIGQWYNASYYVEEDETTVSNVDITYCVEGGEAVTTASEATTANGRITITNTDNTIDLHIVKNWTLNGASISDIITGYRITYKVQYLDSQEAGENEENQDDESSEDNVTWRDYDADNDGTIETYTLTYTKEGTPEMTGNVVSDLPANKQYRVVETAYSVTIDDKEYTNSGFETVGTDGNTVNSVTTITFTNALVDMTVIKIDEETREKSEKKYLVAKFKLLRYNPEATTEDKYKDVVGESLTAEDDGKLTFAAVGPGKYKIVETQTPDGYIRADNNDCYFTVDSSGNVTWTDAAGNELNNNSTSGKPNHVSYESNTFTVGNTPGPALPASGGPGTRLFTILGSILLAGAGLLLWRRRRLMLN